MANYGQVSYGSKGSNVTELQKLLNNNGYSLDVDGDFGSKTQAAVKDYQQKNGLSVDGIVGTNTWGALTKANASSGGSSSATPAEPKYQAYTPSETVLQADALLKEQLGKKPGEYQSTWQDQLLDIIGQIQNGEKFEYDLNADALYQQYKDQYVTQGKLAMMDTMGQAAAMTGGYGNSYAQSVGQQAYQGYLQGLNDKVPELYGMALDKYNQDRQALYDQASLIAGMEDQSYSRYMDQLTNYYTELGLAQDEARYQAEQDYGRWMDNLSFQYQQDRDKVSDEQWQKTFDENVRQYNEQMALSKSKSSGSSSGSGTTTKTTTATAKKTGAYMGNAKNPAYNTDLTDTGTGNKDLYGLFKSYDATDWEGYFCAIRQAEGKAAAELELKQLNAKGLIPQNMVYYASIGARGNLGH